MWHVAPVRLPRDGQRSLIHRRETHGTLSRPPRASRARCVVVSCYLPLRHLVTQRAVLMEHAAKPIAAFHPAVRGGVASVCRAAVAEALMRPSLVVVLDELRFRPCGATQAPLGL
jgi:hypothetical protein